ncbi:MAG TPA: hypothetical protein VMP00_04655 [Burkholderiales bacterium]|nr:hypothetical protein [Burkholderiales bacterium]
MIQAKYPAGRMLLPFVLLAALFFAGAVAYAASIEIVRPQDGETIQDNEGHFEVRVNADLGRDQRIQVLMDGVLVAPASENRVIAIRNVDRGEHGLKAQLVDDRGHVVAESRAITFYMWQASALFPGRTQPSQPGEPPAPPPTPQPRTAPLTPSGQTPAPGPQPQGAPLRTN